MEPYQRLEAEWAAFNDLDPAGMVACSSGTAALHLALEAAGLSPGAEVLCGDFNMVAVPRAVALAGLTPVFVDCRDDLLMDPEAFRRAAAAPSVRAVVVTHVYGRRWDRFHELGGADEADPPCWVVEDLAEAHGVRPHYAVTDAACWSFYRNKIVAGEEGGAVWFRNPDRAAHARRLRSLGFTEAHDYRHVPRGHNYRMSNLHARCILDDLGECSNPNALRYARPFRTWAPMRDHPGTIARRREIESWYDAACPPAWRMPVRDAVWVYDVCLPVEAVTYCNTLTDKQYGMPSYATVDRLVGFLKAAGIEARHGFKPMSRQEEFRGCRRVLGPHTRSDVSVADLMSCRVLYLPVQPGRTVEADCRRAFQVLREALPQVP